MKMKKLMGVVLALVLVLALGTTAYAEGTVTPMSLTTAKIVKTMNVADGINIEDVDTFTFHFVAEGSDSAALGDHPAIADKTVTVGQQENDVARGEINLSFIGQLTFPHAGEYVYTVTESTAAIDAGGKKLTVDGTAYTLRVYVENQGDSLSITGVTLAKGGEKVESMSFENTYTELLTNPLTVTKRIEGTYADMTKKFPITVTVTLPGTASAADVTLAADSKGTLDGLVVTAELGDGEYIKFATLPAGATVRVNEDQAAFYSGEMTGFVTARGGAGVDLESSESAPIVQAQSVTVTNTRDTVIPTGVIIENAPYALLFVLAVAGVVYLQLKKKANA